MERILTCGSSVSGTFLLSVHAYAVQHRSHTNANSPSLMLTENDKCFSLLSSLDAAV